MRRRASWVLGLWVAALALAGARAARADEEAPEKAQARLLLSQGNALFEKGDLKGALVDFRAAYALFPSPKLLVNAAAAERELGDLPGAANDLRRFLDDAPDDDPFLVERARQDLRAIEKKVGRIALTSWPPRSTLEVDGRALRDVAYVRPGEHHVRGRAPTGGELERDLTVGAGESLELPAPAAPAQRLALVPAPGGAVDQRPAKSRWWIGVVVASVSVAAAGIAVGVYFGTRPGQPLRGDLGVYKFSDFH